MLKNFFKRAVHGYKILSKRQMPEEPIPVKVLESVARPVILVAKPGEEQETEETEAEEVIKVEDFEIPKFLPTKIKIGTIKEEEKIPISLTYPLIPKKPAKDEPIFAYAKIFWDTKLNKYIYQMIEPELSEKLKTVLSKVKELIEQKLDVDFSKLKKFEATEYLRKNIEEILTYFRFEMSEDEKRILQYFIERDFIGLGRIEPFINDEQIEDISCDGVNIPLFVFHRNPELGSVETSIKFEDSDELDSFIYKLSQLCGKSISVASPLVGGSLPDGSRVQATLATDIARRGSNFTIRKFTEKPLTPIHLLQYNTLDVQIMAFLWLAVDYGKSILISGGTASGKTSLLNVLSLFIRPEKKICSIEDTPELKLPHPHWVPSVARVPIAEEVGRRVGDVDLFDLLKESLRQRPDYIIVGEVRGKEAYVLFQQMATGHPSFATIHAENLPKLVDRLTTAPISLPPSLLGSLDLVLFLLMTRYKDKQVRRISEVMEVTGVDDKEHPITNRIFKWNSVNDKFEISSKSSILRKISEATGLTEKQLKDELERRMFVLSWMKENNIIEYEDVFNVLNMYYTYPERVLATIRGV